MMDGKDLPSNSDDSDEDFVPEGKPSSDEDSVSANSEEDSESEKETKSCKRRKVVKKKKKKKEDGKSSECDEEEVKEKQIDKEALWRDFLNGPVEKEKSNKDLSDDNKTSGSVNEKRAENNSDSPKINNVNKRTIPCGANSGSKLGLSKILGQLGKKEKLSTLEKSKLDWNNFKKSEGIEEEIKLHNKGKDGYLDKQDFLQRTDMRQFEIEKQLRASRRHF